ncbi:MAG: hypothetical protein ACLTMP_08675 [Eggerthella lenta]
MSTVHERDGEIVAAVKGAIDSLLPRCAFIMDEDGAADDRRGSRARWPWRNGSDEALRVLAFATAPCPACPATRRTSNAISCSSASSA